MRMEIERQSDRRATIVCAERLSERLGEAIESRLVRNIETTAVIDRVFGDCPQRLQSHGLRVE